MNDFGVPMNDAEMSMKPIKPHERLMAESGVESNWEFFAAAAISTIGSIIGGNKASKAAKSQVDANNEATEAQYQYDLELHEMNQNKIIADREEAIIAIETRANNEGKRAAYLDAVAKSK